MCDREMSSIIAYIVGLITEKDIFTIHDITVFISHPGNHNGSKIVQKVIAMCQMVTRLHISKLLRVWDRRDWME